MFRLHVFNGPDIVIYSREHDSPALHSPFSMTRGETHEKHNTFQEKRWQPVFVGLSDARKTTPKVNKYACSETYTVYSKLWV